MPKLDLDAIEQVNRTGYPPPFNRQVAGRWYRRLAPAGGLSDFGVSHVVLKPGAWSSPTSLAQWRGRIFGDAERTRRCWSRTRDGRCLAPGDCAAWPKGSTNGHHLINESDADCAFVVVGGGREYRRRLFATST